MTTSITSSSITTTDLTVDSADNLLKVDHATNKIGIGTDSPGAILDVNDDGVTDNAWNTLAKFRPDLSDNHAEAGIHIQSYPSTTVVADRRAGIQSIGDAGNATSLTLNKDGGKVGIANDNPLQTLSVGGRMNVDQQKDYYGAWIDGNTSSDSFFAVGTWHNNGGRMTAGSSIGAGLHLHTHNTGHPITLQKDGGKVGIGTNSPKSELNISANNSGQGAKLTIENTDTSITANDVIGQIDFYANDGSTNGTGAKVNIKAIATSNAGTVTALTLGVASSASATAVETMRLKSDEVNWTNTTNGFYNKIYGPSSGDIASGYLTYNGSTLRGGFYTNPSHGLTVISEVDMSLRVNNANRMHINTSGIVTTPNVPAFLAFKSNGPVNSNQIVVWNNVYHNNGGYYSSSTGKFTAPVDGYYHFTVGAIIGGSPVDGTQRNGELQMQKNGNYYSRGHWNHADRWENVSYTQIMYLAANDYVRVNFVNSTGNNEMYGSSLYSHFGGHLIG